MSKKIGKAEAPKIEYASANDLLFPPDPIDIVVESEGRKLLVKARPITLAVLSQARKQAGDNEFLFMASIVSQCLKEPEISFFHAQQMKYDILLQIFEKLQEISGLTEESLRRVTDYPTQRKGGQ